MDKHLNVVTKIINIKVDEKKIKKLVKKIHVVTF